MSPPAPPDGWPVVRTDAGARKIVERLDGMRSEVREAITSIRILADDLETATAKHDAFEQTALRRISARPTKHRVMAMIGTGVITAAGLFGGAATWAVARMDKQSERIESQAASTKQAAKDEGARVMDFVERSNGRVLDELKEVRKEIRNRPRPTPASVRP